jgi:hypothetical protein
MKMNFTRMGDPQRARHYLLINRIQEGKSIIGTFKGSDCGLFYGNILHLRGWTEAHYENTGL